MRFAPMISCRDGSRVRVNPDLVVAVEQEGRHERSAPRSHGSCRVSLADGEQLDVLAAADKVQHTLGLSFIRLVLCPGGTPIFLNPIHVLAVEDRSGDKPRATGSLVTITSIRHKAGAEHSLTSPFMVRETAQQIMDAILATERALAPGPNKVLDRSEGPGAARAAPGRVNSAMRRRRSPVACPL